MHRSFPFWPFLRCRFSLSPHFARQTKSKILLVSFKQPPNTCRAGWANFFQQNMLSWNTLVLVMRCIPLMQLLFLLPLFMKMAHKVIFAMTKTSRNNPHPLIYFRGNVSALIQQLQNNCKWDKSEERFHGSLSKRWPWGMNQRRFNYIRVHSHRQGLFPIKSGAKPNPTLIAWHRD